MKESLFQKKVLTYFEASGAECINFGPSTFMSRGIADIFVNSPIFMGFFELKCGKNIYSESQQTFIWRHNRANPKTAWGLRLDGDLLTLEKVELRKVTKVATFDFRIYSKLPKRLLTDLLLEIDKQKF